MPITPYLSGQAFDPETLRNMGKVFEEVCARFGLPIRHDPATEVLAKFIIERAQRGMRDYDVLLKATLVEFG